MVSGVRSFLDGVCSLFWGVSFVGVSLGVAAFPGVPNTVGTIGGTFSVSNSVKYAQELDRGNTILKKYGDSQTQICHFGGYIADIYEDARLVNVAVGELRLGNINQIHDEILKKLESMAHTRQRDTKISGYPIPYCCKLEITPADVYGKRTVDCRCYHHTVHSGHLPHHGTGQLGIGGKRHHRL